MKKSFKILFALCLLATGVNAQQDTCSPYVNTIIYQFPGCDTCGDGMIFIPEQGVTNIYWTDAGGKVLSRNNWAIGLYAGEFQVTYTDSTGCASSDTINIQTMDMTFGSGCTFDTEFEYEGTGVCGHGANFMAMTMINSTGVAPYDVYNLNRNYWTTFPVSVEASVGDWYESKYEIGIIDANGCTYRKEIILPELYDFEFIVTSPSCSTCTDGAVEAVIKRGMPENNVTFNYRWNKINPDQFLSSDSILAGVGVGVYELYFFGDGGCGVWDTVTVEFGGPDGINVLTRKSEHYIYPNPAIGIIRINVGASEILKDVLIYDITGSLVHVPENANSELNLSDLPAGVYHVEIVTNHTRSVQRFALR